MFLLLLDDVEINNVLMAEALRGLAGCKPVAFTSPVEALAFVRSRAAEIGVAITDFDMPGMDGQEFIAAARSVEGFQHVPIVMVTSNDQRKLRRDALAAGATDFLVKPFDPAEVKARVSNLLRLRLALQAEEGKAALLAREVAAAVSVIEAREREIVTRLVNAAEHRDTDTGEHVSRVADHVRLIARGLGFDPSTSNRMALASTMHDVGKIAVPDAILLKPGPLTPGGGPK